MQMRNRYDPLEENLDRESTLACGIAIILIFCCSFGFLLGYVIQLVTK